MSILPRLFKLYRHIPNTLTLLNLFFGSVSILLALSGNLLLSAYFLLIAFHCDIFDGLSARLLKVSSALGKELDSLSDVVSFGLAPAMILHRLLLERMGLSGFSFDLPWWQVIQLLVPFILPMFAALRLAKFNLDETQKNSFSGLPTPANALLVLSIPVIISRQPDSFLVAGFQHEAFYLVYPLVISTLMVLPVRLYSLKPEGLNLKKNLLRFAFLLVALLTLIITGYTGLFLIVILYYVYAAIVAGWSGTSQRPGE